MLVKSMFYCDWQKKNSGLLENGYTHWKSQHERMLLQPLKTTTNTERNTLTAYARAFIRTKFVNVCKWCVCVFVCSWMTAWNDSYTKNTLRYECHLVTQPESSLVCEKGAWNTPQTVTATTTKQLAKETLVFSFLSEL